MGKGHKYLLKAFEEVYETNKGINLLIVGDGDQKDKLLNQINGYKSKSNIYFLSNRNDVKEILKISDIFVLATEGEGMSNAILEAMASGLPIITTDIPENKELIENKKTGFLIPVKNSEKLAEKIIYLLKKDAVKVNISNKSKNKIAKNFETKKVIKELATLYNSI
jgi:glycosyltransferase involved in cell wall biosynthesis